MLHIIQVVMWGVAETPQLFADEERARAAYVACAGKHWEQRYAAYCEHNGVSRDSFLSAQAFVRTLDASEKSMINFWSLNKPEITGGSGEVRHIVRGMQGVKDGLAKLLADVNTLTESCVQVTDSDAGGAVDATRKPELSPPFLKQERIEPDPEKYKTKEWQNFVATIQRLCSGSRNGFPLLPRDDWRQDVYSNRTSLEYWDWVADNVERYKEEALAAEYSVSEDATSPGYYRFANNEGTSDESYYSEWEAWCAAGMHHQANRRAAAG